MRRKKIKSKCLYNVENQRANQRAAPPSTALARHSRGETRV